MAERTDERTEKGTKKHHKHINDALRAGRGVSVDIPISVPESSKGMGLFIRVSVAKGYNLVVNSGGRETGDGD